MSFSHPPHRSNPLSIRRRRCAVAEALEQRRLLTAVDWLSTDVKSDHLDVMAAGDFNSDGRPDVAAINASTHTLYVYRGNGDGTFQTPSSRSLGTLTPAAAVATDVNADGKCDLVLTEPGANRVDILPGDGSGGFAPTVTYSLGATPGAMVVADFNHDDRPDVIAVDPAAASLTVLLQSPTGAFYLGPTIPAPFNPSSLAVADVNGDHNPDVAAVGNSSDILLLYGNGDGTFTTSTAAVPGTLSHSSVLAEDFNNDGRVDLAVSQAASTHQLAQLFNNGNGTFSAPTFTELSTLGGPMIPGHFLSHTSNDLIITPANGSFGFSRLLTSTATGLQPTDPVSLGGSNVFAAADFNGDGLTDTACYGWTSVSKDQVFFQRVQPLTIQAGTVADGSQPSGLTVAHLTDVLAPPAGSLHAYVDWGDGRASGGTVVDDGNGQYHVLASHNYLFNGYYRYTVSVSDDWGNSVSVLQAVQEKQAPNSTASLTLTPLSAPIEPRSLSPDGTGNLWVSGQVSSAAVAALVSPGGHASAYPLPSPVNGNPFAVDLQHNFWRVSDTSTLTRVTPAGTVTNFPVSAFGLPAYAGFAIATGPDGQPWFTLTDPGPYKAISFAHFTAGGGYATVPLQRPLTGAATNMVLGADGDFWVTETAPWIARVSPGGQVTEFPLTLPDRGVAAGANLVVAGADGAVWFNLFEAGGAQSYIGRITAGGQVSLFPPPAGGPPSQISAAPDGSLWFSNPTLLGRVTPAGCFTYFPVPSPSTTTDPVNPFIIGTSVAPDGNVYFTENLLNNLGKIDPTGLLNISPVADLRMGADGKFSGPLLSFTDPRGARPVGAYDASVDWGDGTRSIAQIAVASDGTFTVAGAHTYLTAGHHDIAVTLCPPGDITQTRYVGEDVPPASLSLVVTNPLVVQRNIRSNATAPLLVFSNPDPGAPASRFTATIDWGDSGSSAGTVGQGAAPGQFVVTGQHIYAAAGDYTAVARVFDSGTAALLVSLPVHVYAVANLYMEHDFPAAGSGYVVAGDFNNDQIPDVASVWQSTLSVLLGNGDYLFKPSLASTVPAASGNPVAADFNHDGNLDLAYPVASTPPTTAVLFGHGDGTFSPATTLAMSSTHLVTADFSGDGVADLVGSGGAALQLATSPGGGSFAISSLPVSGQVDQLITGDFNADHKSDLAVVTRASGAPQLIVLLGNGNGTFQATAALGLGFSTAGALDVAAGDVDRDGRPDLLVTDASANQMIVLHGNGDGSFAPAPPLALELTPSAAPQLSGLALQDLNEDGVLELITSDTGDGKLHIRVGLDDGTFAPDVLMAAGPPTVSGFSVVDFNGDSVPDIAIGGGGTGVVTTLDNNATPGQASFSAVAGTLLTQANVFSFGSEYTQLDLSNTTATIDWGDGTVSDGGILPGSSPGTFAVSGAHLYKHAGLVFPTAYIHRNQFAVAVGPGAVFVTQPTLTFSPSPRLYTYGQPATDAVALFHDPNPFSRPSDFSVTVNLGNGQTVPGLVLRDPAGGPGDYMVVLSQAAVTAPGNHVTLTDADGGIQYYQFYFNGMSVHNGGTSISGNVFEDLNRDGVLQAGEGPQTGWRVFDDLNGNGVWDPASEPTDLVSSTGTYTLSDVPAGNANVWLQSPAGWTVTPPTPAAGWVVPVTSGQTITGVNFSTVHLPPVVTSSRFNYDGYPRSVTFTLSEKVTGATSAGAYAVYNVDTGQPYPVASASFDADLNVLTLSFAGNLPDGNYEAVLYPQPITDSAGQHLGASPQGPGGIDAYLSFYSLAGDVNRDGVVDFNDANLVYSQAGDYAHGDVNGDGYVGSADGIIIARNYQKRSQPPVIHPGDLIASSTFDGTVYDIAPDGTKTVIGHAGQPEGVASDGFGNVYVAELGGSPVDHLVRISNRGVQSTFTTFASDRSNPEGLVLRPDGTLMVTGWFNANPGYPPPGIATITPDGQVHPYVNCGVSELIAATLDSAGNLYAVDVTGDNGSLWKVSPAGMVTEVARDLVYATGVAVAPDGTVLVSDSLEDKIWAVAPDGSKSVYLTVTRPFALLFDPQGNLYIGQDEINTAGDAGIIRVSPDGTRTVIATGLDGVRGLAFVAPPPRPNVGPVAPSSTTQGTTTATTFTPPLATTPLAPPDPSTRGGNPAPHDKGAKPAKLDSKLLTAASISSRPAGTDSHSKNKSHGSHR